MTLILHPIKRKLTFKNDPHSWSWTCVYLCVNVYCSLCFYELVLIGIEVQHFHDTLFTPTEANMEVAAVGASQWHHLTQGWCLYRGERGTLQLVWWSYKLTDTLLGGATASCMQQVPWKPVMYNMYCSVIRWVFWEFPTPQPDLFQIDIIVKYIVK